MSIEVSSSPTMSVSSNQEKRTAYLRQLLSQRSDLSDALLSSGQATWVQDLRQQAVSQVQELAMPSTRDEEWRFTDLSGLMKLDFQAPSGAIAPPSIEDWIIPETATSRLVFINGQYVESL